MPESVNGNTEHVKRTLNEFEKVLKNDSFNVVKDKKKKKQFKKIYTKIKARMNFLKPICVIFDAQNSEKRLIDRLAGDNICSSRGLRLDLPYLIVNKESKESKTLTDAGMNIVLIENENSNSLGESLFLLAPEDYTSFFKELRIKIDKKPQVIVLVLDSPDEIGNDEIQSFMLLIQNEYNEGNFILLFKDVEDYICTDIDNCIHCYPDDIADFLNSTKFKFPNRIFKVSTASLDNYQEDSYSDEFNCFQEVLENELNNVEKINKDILNAYKLLNDINKTFDQNKVKEEILDYDSILKEKSEIWIDEIKKEEKESSDEMFESLKTQIQNETNKNKDLSENFILTYQLIQENFGKKLINLELELKNTNEEINIGEMARDMFYNIDDQKTKDEIERLTQANFQNVDMDILKEEFNDENNSKTENKTMVETFMNSVQKTCGEIYTMVSNGFQTFVKSFRRKADENVENLKETIDEEVKEYKERIWPEEMDVFFDDLKININGKINNIQTNLNEKFNKIDATIKSKAKKDIYPCYIGFYIFDFTENLKINSEIESIKTEINSRINSVLITEFNKPFFQSFLHRLSHFREMDKVLNQFDKCIYSFLGTLNEDRFYEEYLSKEEIQTSQNVGGHIKNLWRNVRRMSFLNDKARYTKELDILNEFEGLKVKLNNFVNDINKLFTNSIDEFLESGRIE